MLEEASRLLLQLTDYQSRLVKWYKCVLFNLHHFQSVVGLLVQTLSESRNSTATQLNFPSSSGPKKQSKHGFIKNGGVEAASLSLYKGSFGWTKHHNPNQEVEDREIRRQLNEVDQLNNQKRDDYIGRNRE
jgi:hypothetical protein